MGWVERFNANLPFGDNLLRDGNVQIADINGDGLVDFFYNFGSSVDAYIHNGVVPDLLSTITYSAGGSTNVTYQMSAQYKDGSNYLLNPNLPFNVMTVKTLTDNDGRGFSATTTYSYEGGKYYYGGPFDRRFAGFARIKKTDSAGNVTTTFYHQGDSSDSTHGEYSDESWKIGKVYLIETADSSGNLYRKIVNKWDSYDLGNGRKFVKLAQTVECAYDGDSTHKDNATSFTYDNTDGNQTQKIEWGGVTGSDDGTFINIGTDEFTTSITYASNTGANILGLPSQQTTTDQNGVKVKETNYFYDNLPLGSVSKGNLTKQEQWKAGTVYINTQKNYNSFGLITQETDPNGNTTSYSYDDFDLYSASITNAENQTTVYTYDYSSGKLKQTTDPNGFIFQTVYDGLDRVIEEKQPDISNPSSLVTKTSYEYTNLAVGVSTKRTDYLDSTNSVDSYTYTDGFDRVIQTRKEAEAADTFAVVDFVYNNVEQLHKESLPYFSSGSSRTPATTNNALYIVYTYDPLQRVTAAANAAGTTSYTFDDWKVTIIDARGKRKTLHKDAYDNLIKVDEEYEPGILYATQYGYDGLSNLTRLIDAHGNIRNFTYDSLGNRLTAEDLHAPNDTTFGKWVFTYYNNGNLKSKQDPKGQDIKYTYDRINRVKTEDHTQQAGVNIIYTYDNCPGGIGRLYSVANSGASEARQYNALGLISRESKVINSVTYQTDYSYDRQGNTLTVTNPDNSQVKYEYNTGGLIDQVLYKEAAWGSFLAVVLDFDYNPAGAVSYI